MAKLSLVAFIIFAELSSAMALSPNERLQNLVGILTGRLLSDRANPNCIWEYTKSREHAAFKELGCHIDEIAFTFADPINRTSKESNGVVSYSCPGSNVPLYGGNIPCPLSR